MTSTQPEFLITRTFNAPRELVWRAWTDPKLAGQWFGPKGSKTHVQSQTFAVGGFLHLRMTMPDGSEMWGKYTYREITPPSRLVYINAFSDKDGNITRHPMAALWPLELLTTVILEEAGDKTKLTLTWSPLNASAEETQVFAENMPSMNGGWGGSFDQLDIFLANTQK